jgi:hypothetical protein
VTPFAGKRFDCLQVPAIVNSPEITATFPQQTLTESGYPVVCWKYEHEAGSFIISDKAQIRKMEHHKTSCQHTTAEPALIWKSADQVSQRYICSCSSDSFWNRFTDSSGHVCTSDLSCIVTPLLRDLMKKGPTFRSDFLSNTPHNSAEDDISLFTQTLSTYVERSAKSMHCNSPFYDEWKGLILSRLRDKLKKCTNMMIKLMITTKFQPEQSRIRMYKRNSRHYTNASS